MEATWVPILREHILSVRQHRPAFRLACVLKSSYLLTSGSNFGRLAVMLEQSLPADAVVLYAFSNFSDAVAARAMGLRKRILCLYYVAAEEASVASEHGVEIGCPNRLWFDEAMSLLARDQHSDSRQLLLHLWLDVGLCREGYRQIHQMVDDAVWIQRHYGARARVVGFGAQCQQAQTPGEHARELLQNVLQYDQAQRNCYVRALAPQLQHFARLKRAVEEVFGPAATKRLDFHIASSKHVALNIREMSYSFAPSASW